MDKQVPSSCKNGENVLLHENSTSAYSCCCLIVFIETISAITALLAVFAASEAAITVLQVASSTMAHPLIGWLCLPQASFDQQKSVLN